MALDIFPFYHLSNNQLQDEFATSEEKLKEILENANLQKINFSNLTSSSLINYVKDEFNANLKNCNDSKLSLFHLNNRSLNCHHKELSVYLSLLNMQFDCLCLFEVWNNNLNFYKNIFPSYRGPFEKAIDSKLVGVAIFIKNELKISNRTNDIDIEFSKNV